MGLGFFVVFLQAQFCILSLSRIVLPLAFLVVVVFGFGVVLFGWLFLV